MKKSEISKTFYQKLTCKIYILGAASEGESILFVLYGDEQVIYSCITDSFKLDGVNVPIYIAEKCNLNHITDVFWTHPHDDHSDGLIEIVERFKPEYVYIPANLQNLPFETPGLSREVLEKINQYNSYDRRYSYQPYIEDIGANYIILDKTLNVAGKKIPFSIYAIAPVIGKVRRDVITDNFNKLNDFSIAISIIVGDFSLLLTGDIQNQMIQYVLNSLQTELVTPNILKIPHHGSKGSLDIITLFDRSISIDAAISTSKQTSHLPKKEALDAYSSYCNRVYKICDGSKSIGIWGVEINIVKATISELDLQNYTEHINR